MKGVAAISCSIIAVFVLSWVAVQLLGGSDHSDTAPRVRAQLQNVAAKLEVYERDTGRLPAALDELLGQGSAGRGPYARARDLVDPWGEKFHYRVNAEGAGFVLFTLGRDRRLGGSGDDRDLQVEFPLGGNDSEPNSLAERRRPADCA